ncbi:MAG: hypothetical protein Q4D38_01960 [Planctomycetia bacterium]|nr:hypothetical protein [Planctomycetia bacterium]
MRTLRTSFIVVLLGVALSPLGCRWSSEESEPPNSTLSAPLSIEEAEGFARTLETRLKQGDGVFFIRAMDWSSLTDRVLEGLEGTPEAKQFSRADLLRSFSGERGFAQTIALKVRNGGAYSFLRAKKNANDEISLTFRLVEQDGGLDYHDLYVRRMPDGGVGVYEIHLYHFGENFSETLRRALVPERYVGGVTSYGTMMSDAVQILFRERSQDVQRCFSAFEEGRYQDALNIYDQLPPELRVLKPLVIIRLQAAQKHPDEGVYRFVLAEAREQMRDDVCADFLSLDYFFNHKMYENALDCVDRIDAYVGGDIYLNFFRCYALVHLAQCDRAKQLFLETITKDPSLKEDPTFRGLGKILEKSTNSKAIDPFEEYVPET